MGWLDDGITKDEIDEALKAELIENEQIIMLEEDLANSFDIHHEVK